MRRRGDGTRCDSESTRNSESRYCEDSYEYPSDPEPEPEPQPVTDELPGVDYKNKFGPRSLRHYKLNLNTNEGESRFLSSVKKELGRKENIQKIQTAFQNDTALASKQVWCTNQYMCVNFSSPLEGITVPHYVEKWKNPALIKDIPMRAEDEEDGAAPAPAHVRPTILAVNMKWRNGVEVKKCHKFTTKTINLEPVMKKTEFDFETKTRFTAEVKAAITELFPDTQLMIVNENGLAEGSAMVARSSRLHQDGAPSTPAQGTGAGNPYCRQWTEYTDLDEHRILAIPSHTRNGFDTDLGRKYEFPYEAKFVIGRKVYHHKFMVHVPLSKSPQHYGLIFTFSEDPQGHSKLRIKSLLTIYSVFPVKPKFACLETYEKNNLDEEEVSKSPSPKSNRRTKRDNESTQEARKAVLLVTENLKEEKLESSFGGVRFSRDLAKPAQDHYRFRRLHNDSLHGKKDKKKKNIAKSIEQEQEGKDVFETKKKSNRR